MKLKAETLRKIIEVGEKGYVFVATADAEGLPHLAAAGNIGEEPEGRVFISEWFCPGTVENLSKNRRVTVVVWDAAQDRGYQVSGEVERVDELSEMDGFIPPSENEVMPQVERKLVVRVDKVTDFSRAPHSDKSIGV